MESSAGMISSTKGSRIGSLESLFLAEYLCEKEALVQEDDEGVELGVVHPRPKSIFFGNPITVTLTDECPGACNNDPVHFDISGIAFKKLAKSGEASQLYNAGRISIFYQRIACNYNTNIIFKVDKGSNPNFFAVTSEAVNGDGDLSLVEIQASNSRWVPMQRMNGATWSVGIQPDKQKPLFSLRLTSETKQSVTASNVIPDGWQPGSIYKSNVNFPNNL
ncbi:putative expansin-B2 [Nicotiana sylvestris]|uniref:putative expansin-B2 n=1 Tax=Nicotiana sylvestris TaxID=4096 RepID=UPI00388C5B04